MRRGRRLWLRLLVVACGALVAGGALAGCDARSRPSVLKPAVSASPGVPVPRATGSLSPVAGASVSHLATPSVVVSSSAGVSGFAAGGTPYRDPHAESIYPQAAAKEDVAVETIRRFFEGLNYEIDTNEETKLTGLYLPSCKHCALAIASIHDQHRNGQVTQGAHNHLENVEFIVPVGKSVLEIWIIGTEDAAQVYSASGQLLHTYPSIPPTRLQFFVNVGGPSPVIMEFAVKS